MIPLINRPNILCIPLLCLLLEGCAGYSTGFDCPIGEGLKCTSLSEVNRRMDRGDLHLEGVQVSKEETEEQPYPRFWKESSGKKNPDSRTSSCSSCARVYWTKTPAQGNPS